MPGAKTRRQEAIAEILAARAVSGQEDLERALERRGFRVAQSTVSRDLKEMGVARMPDGESYRYALPGTPAPANGTRLRAVSSQEVLRVEANEVAVVVRTLTGRAQGVGVYLDALRRPDVLGTIAGDDTILVLPRSVKKTAALARDLAALLGTD